MITPSVSTVETAAQPALGLPTFRIATPEDDQFVEDLQALAFGPGRFARTAFRVRERFPIDKSLSLVTEIGGSPATVLTTPDRTLAATVWVRDGIVTVVAGALDADEVLSVARSLR